MINKCIIKLFQILFKIIIIEIYSEGKLPSYENLVKVVSEKFQVQKEINQVSSYFINNF